MASKRHFFSRIISIRNWNQMARMKAPNMLSTCYPNTSTDSTPTGGHETKSDRKAIAFIGPETCIWYGLSLSNARPWFDWKQYNLLFHLKPDGYSNVASQINVSVTLSLYGRSVTRYSLSYECEFLRGNGLTVFEAFWFARRSYRVGCISRAKFVNYISNKW